MLGKTDSADSTTTSGETHLLRLNNTERDAYRERTPNFHTTSTMAYSLLRFLIRSKIRSFWSIFNRKKQFDSLCLPLRTDQQAFDQWHNGLDLNLQKLTSV